MKKQILKLINLLLIFLFIINTFMLSVNAEIDLTKTEGSLKITKYEVYDNDQLPLAGVTFDIYKVDDDETSTELPTNTEILATKQSKITEQDGVAIFSNLALGRYLVVEADAPSNVVSKIANFLVDIPMTSADGTELIYDVEVSPKNNTVYGGIVLQKIDEKTNEGLADVEFELQKLEGTTWTKYGELLATADGTTDMDLSGNLMEKGKIEVTGLPAGSYRFVEKTTLTGYILNNKTTYEFNVSLGTNGETIVDNNLIIVKNEKPTLAKSITSKLTEGSVSLGDTVSYKIETPIPSIVNELTTYKFNETIDNGLNYTENTVKIFAIDSNNIETELVLGTDYSLNVATDETTFEILFTENGKINCQKIKI